MPRLILILPLLMLAASTHAANFLVTNDNDSGNGSLRQAMLNANAAIDEPHTISFSGGLYPTGSAIVLQSSLPTITATELKFVGGNAEPVIDGDDTYRVMYASTDVQSLSLRDIELRNGFSNGSPGQGGACLSAANGSGGNLTLERVTFRGCTLVAESLAWGAAVRWSRSSGTVEVIDSRFIGNRTEVTLAETGQGGGGALSLAAAQMSIIGSWFEDNSTDSESGSASGGAISVSTSVVNTIWVSDNTFIHNDASPGRPGGGLGGAVRLDCEDCIVQMERNWFRGNAANSGGALYFRKGYSSPNKPRLLLHNNSFYNHLVSDNGGAVFAGSNVEADMINNSFYNNAASDGAHIAFSGSASVLGFRANLLAPVGTGAPCSGTPAIPTPTAVRDNLLSDGGCVPLNNQALPTDDLGNFQLDERDFGSALSVFWFDGSSVIDAISGASTCDDHDARNQLRPLDGDDDGIAACDVGAFEVPEPLFRDGFED